MLPKTAGSAQTYKSMSFIWIVWSTLYVYLCPHLASWQEARKAIHSSNLLLVSSCWEKREKIGRKNHETKCFFAVKPVQIIWEVLTPPKVFRVRANSESKSLSRQLSLNFHNTHFERFLICEYKMFHTSTLYPIFLSFSSFYMESLLSSNVCWCFIILPKSEE